MTVADLPPHNVVDWGEFSRQVPELATFGADKLTAAPAYLATARSTGAPRVHPVTPIITRIGLFLFMEPTSPKGRDLRERGWFAMHNGVPDSEGSGGEFYVSGHGHVVVETEVRSHAADAARYSPADRYVLFEMRLIEAGCHGYGDIVLPDPRRWSATR